MAFRANSVTIYFNIVFSDLNTLLYYVYRRRSKSLVLQYLLITVYLIHTIQPEKAS